jgi:hypothetical protein
VKSIDLALHLPVELSNREVPLLEGAEVGVELEARASMLPRNCSSSASQAWQAVPPGTRTTSYRSREMVPKI